MNIIELEKLAKAVYSPTKDNWEMRHAFAAFNKEANPQTILAIIELLREMGEALEQATRAVSQEHVQLITEEALAKYTGCMK